MPRASFYFEEFIIFARFCYPPLYSVLSSLELFNFLPLLWVFVSLRFLLLSSLGSFYHRPYWALKFYLLLPAYSEETVISRVEAFWEACRTL